MTIAKKKPFRDVKPKLVKRLADLPDFDKMSRAEEAEWWETHELSDEALDMSPEGMAEARARTYAALGIADPAKHRKK